MLICRIKIFQYTAKKNQLRGKVKMIEVTKQFNYKTNYFGKNKPKKVIVLYVLTSRSIRLT